MPTKLYYFSHIETNALKRLVDVFKNAISDTLGYQIERIPPLNRGQKFLNFYLSSDDRVIQYDFDEVVYQKRSKYQMVSILHSKSFGNVLILDELQNLGEKDLAYTHGLMDYPNINYKDKEILILGGGDGGLLNELVKEDPKFVTLIDIDEDVVNACRKHLRGACASVLDTLKTDKYEIIIGDVIPYLQEFVKNGRKFDVIMNDLTDIPITPDSGDSSKNPWTLVRFLLNHSLQCLNSGGKYLNYVSTAL